MQIAYKRLDKTKRTEILSLWSRVFEDEERYISRFFDAMFSNARVYGAVAPDGTLASMLWMLALSRKQNGRFEQASYLYAAATAPEFRRRGLMHRLISFACDAEREAGSRAVFLVPQNASLQAFYRDQGFTADLFLEKRRFALDLLPRDGEALSVASCDRETFVRQKAAFEQTLPNTVCLPEGFAGFVYDDAIFSGGKVVRLENSTGQAYAVCYKIKEKLYVSELSAASDTLSAAVRALCLYFQTSEATVRGRVGTLGGDLFLFAQARGLGGAADLEGTYLNTMLD